MGFYWKTREWKVPDLFILFYNLHAEIVIKYTPLQVANIVLIPNN